MAAVVGLGARALTHMEKRLAKPRFTEIELRRMMEHATDFRRGHTEGRWIIETRFRREPWEVVVEPIPEKGKLEIITAYEAWNDQ